MKVAIMQPTFIPWLGYFEMIDRVDTFVFLDNVQFEKKSWQNRNYIRVRDERLLVSLPVIDKGLHQSILETELFNAKFYKQKILKTISTVYKHSEFFGETYPIILELFQMDLDNLAEFNIQTIMKLSENFGIETKFVRGSHLKSTGKSTALTIAQCLELGANVFYCAAGAESYVSMDDGFQKSCIEVEYQNYVPQTYKQRQPGFIPFLSVVDLIMNNGFNLEKILEGRV
jgi:hypothetical protein